MEKTIDEHTIYKVLNDVDIGIWSLEFIEEQSPKMYANDTMLRLLGMNSDSSPEDIFKAWFDNIPEESIDIVNNAIDKVKKIGKIEIEYLWGNSEIGKSYVRCCGTLDADFDKGMRLFGYHQNITELYLAKKEAEKFHQLNSDTINLIGTLYDGIYRIDLDEESVIILKSILDKKNVGKTLKFEDFFSLLTKNFVKEEIDELRDILNTSNLKTIISGEKESFIGEFRKKDSFNSYIWYEYTISLQRSYSSGTFVIITIKDITSRKTLEEKDKRILKEAYTSANQANIAKSSFLSRMSHDIRTPMNAIIGMTRMALFNINNIEKVKDCLNKINSAGDLLLNIINQVLDMSKIEVNQYEAQYEVFKLRDFVEELINIYHEAIENKNQTLSLDIENIKNEYVKADMIVLQRILSNLISNAIKYTPNNGKIEISIRELSFGGKNRKCFQFTIKDNGIGMSEEFLKTIYEPFSREVTENTKNISGAGLGMAIVHNLVSLINGTINVESEIGKGTTFYVTLELEVMKDETISEIKKHKKNINLEKLNLEGKKILLVEDNEINREIALELLKLTRATVVEAEDGKKAVDIFINSKCGEFDLILMDIQMPIMNGYEAVKVIRSLDREDASTVYIAAMTANTFSDDIQLAKEAGMNSHISKPINIEALAQVLENIR